MRAPIKRPAIISIVCIIGYVWIIFSFPGIFSPAMKKQGELMPAISGLFIALSFIALVGVWHMKQWGVNLYTVTFFVRQTVLVLMNDISYPGLILSTIFIILFMVHYRKMDINL